MSIKVPLVGVQFCLDILSKNWGQLTLRLFVNDYVPADGDESGAYVEASFSGYQAQPIAAWAEPVKNPDASHYQVQGSASTFTHDGGNVSNNAYGYYVTRQSGIGAGAFEVVWAERFNNPPIGMGVLGDFITVVPIYQDRSEF